MPYKNCSLTEGILVKTITTTKIVEVEQFVSYDGKVYDTANECLSADEEYVRKKKMSRDFNADRDFRRLTVPANVGYNTQLAAYYIKNMDDMYTIIHMIYKNEYGDISVEGSYDYQAWYVFDVVKNAYGMNVLIVEPLIKYVNRLRECIDSICEVTGMCKENI